MKKALPRCLKVLRYSTYARISTYMYIYRVFVHLHLTYKELSYGRCSKKGFVHGYIYL